MHSRASAASSSILPQARVGVGREELALTAYLVLTEDSDAYGRHNGPPAALARPTNGSYFLIN